MKKKIVIVLSLYGIGGAQRRAFTLADKWAAKGYDVHIAALWGKDGSTTKSDFYFSNNQINVVMIPEYYDTVKNNLDVIELNKKIDKEIFILRKIRNFLSFLNIKTCKLNFCIKGLEKSKMLASFLLQHQKALIVNFAFNIFIATYFATKRFSMDVIYAETNASDKYKHEQYFKYIEKAIKKSKAYVFQTNEQAHEHSLENKANTHIIHNPIKVELPEPYTGNREKVIVNFCRLARAKNLLLLIMAFQDLMIDYPDYRLEIYADSSDKNNSEYKCELLKYIQNNHLEESVHILPACRNVHEKIANAAMFVSSSDYEGISNSMIEAMAIGLPCVCTDCAGGGAREMIQNEENGLLVPCGDVDKLKSAMLRMIEEPDLAEKCGRNAALIKERLSIDTIADKWIQIIEKL